MRINDETSSDTKLSGKIETSQQKRGGEYSLSEGNAPVPAPTDSSGSDQAPTGIATSVAMKDDLRTSQQMRGEYSLPEGEKSA